MNNKGSEKLPSVADDFLAFAALHPGQLAIDQGGEAVSYGELASLAKKNANRVMEYDKKSKVSCVGIFAQDPVSTIASMLGVAIAGKYWVLLNPDRRIDTLIHIIKQTNIKLLLTNTTSPLSGRLEACIRSIEDSGDAVLKMPDDWSDIAYLIYTSGTTGAPKAVVQSQRNLRENIQEYRNSIPISSQDRLSFLYGLDVDAALMDIFGALCSGASLHWFDVKNNGVSGILEWLYEKNITVLHCTPTLFRSITLNAGSSEPFQKITTVVFGGEPAYRSDFELFCRLFSDNATLINGFGPSECTIALQARLRKGDTVEGPALPLGKPVGDLVISIDKSQDVESKSTGELVLTANRVALGYWGDEQENKTRFVARNPARSYHTRDLVTENARGELFFVGRLDTFTKLRGKFVNLNEIESRIKKHPHVTGVVAYIRGDEALKQLAVVLEIPGREGGDNRDIKAFVLNEFMKDVIPDRILFLKNFPKTISGKIDRQKTIETAHVGSYLHQDRPIKPYEAWLLSECRKILKQDYLNISDDFFVCGGTSLSAATLLASIRYHLMVDMTVKELYQTPRLEELAELIEYRVSNAEPKVPIIQRNDGSSDQTFSLSPAQRNILASHILKPGSDKYNVSCEIDVFGRIDAALLKKSLQRLHENRRILRSVIVEENGETWQRPCIPTKLDFRIESLDGPESDKSERAGILVDKFITEPFDLKNGPMIRYQLINVSENLSKFIIVGHHVITDALGIRQIWKEVATDYNDYAGEYEPDNMDFLSYVCLHENLQHKDASKHSLSWWRDYLKDIHPMDLSPMLNIRSGNNEYRSSVISFEIPSELKNRVTGISRELRVTAYVLFLSAYAFVLSRYLSSDDITIATPVSNRLTPETRNTIGTFINTLVLRISCDADNSVSEFIRKIQDTVIDVLSRPDVELSKIVPSLKNDEAKVPSALTRVMLNYQEFDDPMIELRGMKTRYKSRYGADQDSVLCLNIFSTIDGFKAEFQYKPEKISPRVADSFVRDYLFSLKSLLSLNDSKLGGMSTLGECEERKLLESCMGRYFPFQEDYGVYRRFIDSAEKNPQKTAVVFGNTRLSYGELKKHVDRLVQEILVHEEFLGPLVPVISEGGLGALIGWLAVLGAGSGFVPIASDWPAERLDESRTIIGSKIELRQNGDRIDVSLVDPPETSYRARSEGNPLIYGFFTSGSSGKPKLATVSERSLLNRFVWMTETFKRREVITIQTTPHIYDSAVWQFIWPLTIEGTCVIPVHAPGKDFGHLIDLIDREKVTIIDFVPSIFALFMDYVRARSATLFNKISSIEYIILGGEAIQETVVREFRRHNPEVMIYNLYGPTEATIGCIASCVNEESAPYSIGKPIFNVGAVIVGHHGHMQPQGVAGELCLTGYCVGEGYYRDESETGKRFQINKYDIAGDKPVLYRTGDIARFSFLNRFEFLGRVDDEIKIRGVRINPVEIENVIKAYPGIADAVVVRHVQNDRGPQLCAIVTGSVLPKNIRTYCLDRLPFSHVPDRFIVVNSIPKLPGGKVDRKAINVSMMAAANPLPRKPDLGSRKSVIVSKIWSEALKRQDVNPDTHFFDVGGNSFLAIQASFEIEKRFDIQLSVIELYRFPVLRDYVMRLEEILNV